MRPKTAARKTTRYVLLAISLVLLFGLGYLFFEDAGRGRQAREIENIRNAQERVQEVMPAQPVPGEAPTPVR